MHQDQTRAREGMPPFDSPQAYASLGRQQRRARHLEVLLVFLRLGLVAFGGPAAHVALMEEELVYKRKWLSRESFLDFWGATGLLPGPNSTELAIHLGLLRGGLPGLFLAGSAFILPAMGMVMALGLVYTRYGSLPELASMLSGISPVVIAIILLALIRLTRSVVKGWKAAAMAGLAIGLYLLGLGEIPLLALIGLLSMLLHNLDKIHALLKEKLLSLSPILPLFSLGIHAKEANDLHPAVPALLSQPGIFFSFLKIGSLLYGSGYVLLAFLEAEFVSPGILSQQQILDAITMGQVTPGPVFTAATFVGFLLGGFPGALSATVGIFLPSFILVLLISPLIPRLRASTWFSGLLDGFNAASLALMAVVSVKLALSALISPLYIALFLLALLLMYRWKVNSFYLVLAGAAAGLLAGWL